MELDLVSKSCFPGITSWLSMFLDLRLEKSRLHSSQPSSHGRILFDEHDCVECYLQYLLRAVKTPNVRGMATVMAEQCQDTKG